MSSSDSFRQQLADFNKSFSEPQIITELTENDIPLSQKIINEGRAPCHKKLCSIIMSGGFVERYTFLSGDFVERYKTKAMTGKKTLAKEFFDPLIKTLRNSNPPMR